MRVKLNRVYKGEHNDAPLSKVRKVIKTEYIDTYEESAYFTDCTEVLMMSGETFVTDIPFDIFDKDMDKAEKIDEEKDL